MARGYYAAFMKAEEEEEERWVKHYSSNHQILLVGDGDFSFSLSLARSFGSASNILASSYDSFDELIKKYRRAKSNLENLKSLGASILHGVDATEMKSHADLRMRRFDRIIFNFPHAGFYGKEDNSLLIDMHRDLLRGFFTEASGMLQADGEIHVNHKTTAPFNHWNLEKLASESSLELVECVDFKLEDYPGYNNKRGAGPRCDEPFPLGECSTYKFTLSPTAKKVANALRNLDVSVANALRNLDAAPRRYQHMPETPILGPHQPILPHAFKQPLTDGVTSYTSGIPRYVDSPVRVSIRNEIPQPPIIHHEFRQPKTNFTAYTIGIPRYVDSPLTGWVRYEIPQHPIRVTNFTAHTNDIPGYVESLPAIGVSNECSRIFHGYSNHIGETYGRTNCDVYYSVPKALKLGFATCMAEEPGRNSNIHLLEELHRDRIARSVGL